VGGPPVPNQAVRSVAPAEHDSNSLEVRVLGASPTPRTVVLTVDGKEKGRRPIAVPNAGALPAAPGGDLEDRQSEAPFAGAGNSQGSTAVLQPQTTRVLFNDLDLGTGTHRITVSL